MSAAAVATIRIPCPFCDEMHTGEFWDEVDEQIMKCRNHVSARKRGDLAAYDPEEFIFYTVTTEALLPREVVVIEDRTGVLGSCHDTPGDDSFADDFGDDPSSDYQC